jgi:hypothetical protein
MNRGEQVSPLAIQSGEALDDAARADLLTRFRGPVEVHDAERVEFWRDRSDAEHARAMIELADFAEKVVSHTGYYKHPDDLFPGFPKIAATTPPE